jgi:hypothetical protein
VGLARRGSGRRAPRGAAVLARAHDPDAQGTGILDQSFVVREGADPELLGPWETAGELVRKLDSGEDVELEDVKEAIENYRELFETVLAERTPP